MVKQLDEIHTRPISDYYFATWRRCLCENPRHLQSDRIIPKRTSDSNNSYQLLMRTSLTPQLGSTSLRLVLVNFQS
jgi:hypothetical protein